jgi:hypothetical protein
VHGLVPVAVNLSARRDGNLTKHMLVGEPCLMKSERPGGESVRWVRSLIGHDLSTPLPCLSVACDIGG